jgi:hypothetical protein
MTEKEEKDIMDLSETYCYTYEVTMVVQIIAPNKEIADARLDKDGGYVSKREVKVLDSVFLYKDNKEEKTEETEETDK